MKQPFKKRKHNANCGTPLFIDAETGIISVCGFKEEGILVGSVKGEKYTPSTSKKKRSESY